MNETIQKHSKYKYTYYQNTHTIVKTPTHHKTHTYTHPYIKNPYIHTPTYYKAHTYTHSHIHRRPSVKLQTKAESSPEALVSNYPSKRCHIPAGFNSHALSSEHCQPAVRQGRVWNCSEVLLVVYWITAVCWIDRMLCLSDWTRLLAIVGVSGSYLDLYSDFPVSVTQASLASGRN